MAEKIAFELVSPVKKLLGKPVAMVSMPGTEGDFAVLPGHAPLIATLRPGVIETYEADKVSDRIFVGGGFVEVTAERCTVLAQEALPVADIDRAALNSTIKELENALTAANDADRPVIMTQLAVAQAKRDAA
ncbi:MAG: ATP synthase F1 subunit epsilon [Alphaproteobacteria bacterium]|nr:ATP synthase F1 subunit epsilon [Alphaproteobacteria bacterium]